MEPGVSPKAQLEEGIDLQQISHEREFSGGSIMNVIRYASLQALDRGGDKISLEDGQGIRREHAKEGRRGDASRHDSSVRADGAAGFCPWPAWPRAVACRVGAVRRARMWHRLAKATGSGLRTGGTRLAGRR